MKKLTNLKGVKALSISKQKEIDGNGSWGNNCNAAYGGCCGGCVQGWCDTPCHML